MGFELDEIIYSKYLKFLKKKKQQALAQLEHKVELTSQKQKLTLIARAVTGKPIELFPAEREGGFKDLNFFLPESCTFFPSKLENEQFYMFRTLYLCTQASLGYNFSSTDAQHEESSQKALETAPNVLKQLFSSYPALQEWFESFYQKLPRIPKTENPDLTWLYGKWMKNSAEFESNQTLNEIDGRLNKKGNGVDPTTILQAKAVEEIESLTIDKKQQEDYVLMHSFEKIEAAEEFNGNWRDFDGKDELSDHADALEEMNMKYTVRVDDTVHSVYQSEFVENTSVAESAEINHQAVHYCYDEWDFKKRQYLKDYCKVYPEKPMKSSLAYYQNTLAKNKTTLNGLRKMLVSTNNKRIQQSRQLHGESFDLDSLTDLFCDLSSGVSPDERIYLSSRKKDKELAITLLIDISLSSDGYVAGNRVIDVAKEAAILFGEILSEFNIHFSIDGFSSKTRNHTSYVTFKDFDEDWNKAKLKIGAAEPKGYTRIGPALRHAGYKINRLDVKDKWVILLSDGKPNDYDKYEGQHGIQDIKQALRELNELQINSFALAIEKQAKFYLPLMFGQSRYQILSSTNQLLVALTKLVEKMRS